MVMNFNMLRAGKVEPDKNMYSLGLSKACAQNDRCMMNLSLRNLNIKKKPGA
jgi:hypothetical protein